MAIINDQGDEGPRLPDRVRAGDHRGVGHAGADRAAVAAAGDLRGAGQRVDRQALRRRLPSRRGDGLVHDGDGGLLRARAEVRQRHRVLVAADGPRVLRAGVRRRHRGGAVLPLVARGAAGLAALRRAAGRDDGRGQALQVRGLHGAADAGDPDRRHGHGPVHADRSRGGRGGLGALPGLRLVSDAQLADADQDLDGDDRDHRDRAVHRRVGVDLRLGADDHADDRGDRAVGAVDQRQPARLPAARQRLPAVRRLLHGDHRGDHHPGPGLHADHRQARDRSGPLRAGDDPQPDDRPADAAGRHGPVRPAEGRRRSRSRPR